MKTLSVGGIIQSILPPPAWGYWSRMLPNPNIFKVKKALVLGVGLGTIPQLIKDNFPNCKITGVDSKFYKHDVEMEFVKGDAFDFIAQDKNRYDLIVVDLWDGGWYPTYVLTVDFLEG